MSERASRRWLEGLEMPDLMRRLDIMSTIPEDRVTREGVKHTIRAFNPAPKVRRPCFVCGRHRAISQSHHLIEVGLVRRSLAAWPSTTGHRASRPYPCARTTTPTGTCSTVVGPSWTRSSRSFQTGSGAGLLRSPSVGTRPATACGRGSAQVSRTRGSAPPEQATRRRRRGRRMSESAEVFEG